MGTLAATGNYTIGTFNPGTLTVNPAPLTVTAADESMTYGGTVPALDLHLHRPGQRRHQRHVQRRPGDHRHVVEQRWRLRDHPGDSGCDRQLHDRHVQPGHADGEQGQPVNPVEQPGRRRIGHGSEPPRSSTPR